MSDGGDRLADRPLFAPRVVLCVLTLGAALLFSSLYFLAEPETERRLDRHGARATSTSAIGYRALVLLLRDLGVAVEVSGRLPGKRDLDGRLLIVTDQEALFADPALLRGLLEAERVLVILPKWQGAADPWRRGWVEEVRGLTRSYPQAVLADLDGSGQVVRPEAVSGWSLGPLPAKPSLPWPQLITSTRLAPVVATDQGLLLGHLRRGGNDRWLLADPDLLSNHGLRQQADLEVPLAVLRHILGSEPAAGRGVLFLDLALRAAPPPTNLFEALFGFPTVIVTLQAAVACLLALWAASGRFGRPLERGRAIRAGKQVLVENAAALLRVGAHHRSVTRRYFEITAARTAQRLHAPPGLDPEARFEWLCRLADSRGLAASGLELKQRIEHETARPVSEQRALDLARHCDRWKRELLHEFGDDPRDR